MMSQIAIPDLLLAEEQTGSPVPVDEFTSLLPVGTDIFVVGENRSGVRAPSRCCQIMRR